MSAAHPLAFALATREQPACPKIQGYPLNTGVVCIPLAAKLLAMTPTKIKRIRGKNIRLIECSCPVAMILLAPVLNLEDKITLYLSIDTRRRQLRILQ